MDGNASYNKNGKSISKFCLILVIKFYTHLSKTIPDTWNIYIAKVY